MSFKGLYKVNKFRMIIYTFLLVIAAASVVIGSFLNMFMVTAVSTKSWSGLILFASLALITFILSEALMTLINDYIGELQMQDYLEQVRNKIAAHFFKDGKKHSVSAFQNRLTNDLELIKNNYLLGYAVIVIFVVYIIISFAALLYIHWSLLVVSIIVDLISFYVPKLMQKPMEKAANNLSEQNKHYLDMVEKWFSGMHELKRYLALGQLIKVNSEAANRLEDANVQETRAEQLMTLVSGCCEVFSTLILYICTGYLISQHIVMLGAIVVISNFAINLSSGLQQIAQALGLMKSVTKLNQQVAEEIKTVDETTKNKKEKPVAVVTNNLMLQFPNGEKLTFPDLKINEGEKILLTGDPGAGKSTLFKLILGILKPTKGRVIFENNYGEEIVPDLAEIGYIPQDPNLFPGTIEENITMFNKKLNSKVEKAIKEVNFSADISKFKNGVREEINLDKLNISGGQRQKIVLARAKVHDSNIILIDEGTSAIDQKATMDILQNLVKSNATIVFIAHNFNEKMHSLFDREIHLVKE